MSRASRPTRSELAERLLDLPADEHLLENWARVARVDGEPFRHFQSLVLELLRDQPLVARSLVQRLQSAGSVADALSSALLTRLHAHACLATGAIPEALSAYETSWRTLSANGHEQEAAKTIIGWADALALHGQTGSAIELVNRSVATLGRQDPARARLRGTAATVHYLAGEFERADSLYRSALKSARQGANPVDAAVSLFNLGNLLLARGRARHAGERFAQAKQTFDEHGMVTAALQCQYGIAATQLHSGHWNEALRTFDSVASDLREVGDRRGAAAIDFDAAELLSGIGADLVAEVHVRRARAEFSNMGLGVGLARASALHARVLGRLGRLQEAASRLSQAATLYQRMGRPDVLRRLEVESAEIEFRRGQTKGLAQRLGRLQRALDREDDRPRALDCRVLRARIALAAGRAGRGLEIAREAYQATRLVPLKPRRPEIAALIAECHAARGDSRPAVAWAKRSVRQLEQFRLQFGGSADALGLEQAQQRIAVTAVDIVLAHGGRNAEREALRILLGVRAGSVIDDLLRGRRREASEAVRVALARIRDRLLGNESDWGDVRGRALRREVVQLERTMKWGPEHESIPGVDALCSNGSLSWDIANLEVPVVVYDQSGTGWRAFVHDGRRSVRCVELPEAMEALREEWIPSRMMLETLARTDQPARERLIQRTCPEAVEALRKLAAALWLPLGLTAKHAVLVATGPINGIPLEAATLEALGDKAPILSRVPHPGLLRDAPPRNRRHALLVEGTVPGAALELSRVQHHLSKRGWSSRTVRTRNSFAARPERCGVIHFATHGSYHRTAWISNGLQMPDGWIGFEQLEPRQVKDALLYFDSCESGLQHSAPGAQLDGWASAAFAAGAHESVLHLWKLDDASATGIADEFYAAWTAGTPAARAMHEARAAVRAAHPHPFHWAGGIVASRQNPDRITDRNS